MSSWWRGGQKRPHLEYRASAREVTRLDAAGRSDEAAKLRLEAISSFSRKADPEQLIKYADELRHNLEAAASQRPGNAIRVLAELDRSCPSCVSLNTIWSTVRKWVKSDPKDQFQDEISAFMAPLVRRNHDPLEVLLAACRSVPGGGLAGSFRQGVSAYLWRHLDQHIRLASGRPALDGHSNAFQLLDLVQPRYLSRGDQICALGDMALAWKSPSEASARYQAAVYRGSRPAGERLAYQHAREGHRLLSAGNIAAARRKFAEACRLHRDREYAFFSAVAELLSDDADTGVVLDKLAALDVPGAPVPDIAFWRALAHLRRGDSERSIRLLRDLLRSHRREGASDQSWGLAEEGEALLAVLEGNDHVLVESAARLVTTHGQRWLSDGPADPLPMIRAVARHDQDLLVRMVALVSNPRKLPEWVRMAGARALLLRSVGSARKGRAGDALGDAELAQQLLRG